MSRFTFRLATLLKLREAVRDQRRAALAEALYALRLVAEQLTRVAGDLQKLKEECRSDVQRTAVPVDRLLEAQRYELILRGEQQQLIQQRDTVVAEVERRREAVMAADREVKVLEKLRERQRERFTHEEERQEMKLIDEAAQRRAPREEAFR